MTIEDEIALLLRIGNVVLGVFCMAVYLTALGFTILFALKFQTNFVSWISLSVLVVSIGIGFYLSGKSVGLFN